MNVEHDLKSFHLPLGLLCVIAVAPALARPLAAAVRVLAGPHTAAGSAAIAPLSSAAAGFARLRCGTVPTRARARNSQHVFKMWTGPWPWPPAGYVTCSCRNGKLCTQHRWATAPPPSDQRSSVSWA